MSELTVGTLKEDVNTQVKAARELVELIQQLQDMSVEPEKLEEITRKLLGISDDLAQNARRVSRGLTRVAA
jgi:predicted ATP-grasp superfamily ATP-dependent carboligase